MESMMATEPNQTEPVQRVRKTRQQKALESRDAAVKKEVRLREKFTKTVEELQSQAKEYEAARQEAVYATGHPLVADEEVVQVPQAHAFLPTLLGFGVPTGTTTTQPALETTLGSDGRVGRSTSDPLDPASDEVDDEDVEDATVAGRKR